MRPKENLKNKRTNHQKAGTSLVVGMERFELSTSSSRTTRANLAALHPDEGMDLGVSVGVQPVWVWAAKIIN